MAKASASTDEKPRLSETGYGLATVLDAVERDNPEAFKQIALALKQIAPHVEALRVGRSVIISDTVEELPDGSEHTVTKRVRGERIRFLTKSAGELAAGAISEGTLLALGIITLASTEGSTILLEDLDRGLHPKAQQALISTLREVMNLHPDLQIIATTHSPYLLEHLESREVRLAFMNEDGASIWAPLEDHPDWPRWQELMSPGEFWSSVGERWVGNGTSGAADRDRR